MSGYTDNVLDEEGVSSRQLPFIQKPFALVTLAGKLREVLDARR